MEVVKTGYGRDCLKTVIHTRRRPTNRASGEAGVSRLALISYARQSSRIFVELPRVAVISTVRVFVVQGLHEVRLVLHALGSGPLSGQVRLQRSSRAPWGLLAV